MKMVSCLWLLVRKMYPHEKHMRESYRRVGIFGKSKQVTRANC